MNKNIELMSKFEDSLDFLDRHPALSNTKDIHFTEFIRNNFCFWLRYECKNNIHLNREFHNNPDEYSYGFNPLESEIRVYRHEHRFDEFVAKGYTIDFLNGEEDEKTEESNLDSIDVKYRDYYGYDWKIDHVSYCGEYSIYRALHTNFIGYEGSTVLLKAPSFEELIIACAEDVQKNYGEFEFEDFLTDEERENHKTNDQFNAIHVDRGFTLEVNNDYIKIDNLTINSRWWDWYRTTKHWEDNWKNNE